MKRIIILATILVAAVSCVSNKYINQVETIKEVTEADMQKIGTQPCQYMNDQYIDAFIHRCNQRLEELYSIEAETKNKKTLDKVYETWNYIDEAIDYAMSKASDNYINNGI